ncbi:MAG: hypothetical protein M3357_15200, partial [Actinomycetota bacterium]|nr:hypothetical protein [Actinomycetota bacterium]
VLSAMAVAYRRAERDRGRAAHPTARAVAYPLPVAANGDPPMATPASPRRRERHLEVVRTQADVSCRR